MDSGGVYWRQQDIVSTDALERLRITVVGAGGIGGHTVRALAKMGVRNIIVYDPDIVEEHNLPNQSYRFRDLGRPKVAALAEIVKDEAGIEILAKHELFNQQPILPGILISAVDSMATRNEIWKRVRYKPSIPYYIEGRMGAQFARIYSFNPCLPQMISWYEESMLYSDAEADELPCTARAIIYNTYMTAALICHLVAEFTQGKQSTRETIFDFVTRTLLVN